MVRNPGFRSGEVSSECILKSLIVCIQCHLLCVTVKEVLMTVFTHHCLFPKDDSLWVTNVSTVIERYWQPITYNSTQRALSTSMAIFCKGLDMPICKVGLYEEHCSNYGGQMPFLTPSVNHMSASRKRIQVHWVKVYRLLNSTHRH